MDVYKTSQRHCYFAGQTSITNIIICKQVCFVFIKSKCKKCMSDLTLLLQETNEGDIRKLKNNRKIMFTVHHICEPLVSTVSQCFK